MQKEFYNLSYHVKSYYTPDSIEQDIILDIEDNGKTKLKTRDVTTRKDTKYYSMFPNQYIWTYNYLTNNMFDISQNDHITHSEFIKKIKTSTENKPFDNDTNFIIRSNEYLSNNLTYPQQIFCNYISDISNQYFDIMQSSYYRNLLDQKDQTDKFNLTFDAEKYKNFPYKEDISKYIWE